MVPCEEQWFGYTDVITMTELMCSWQEKTGANSIEALTPKKALVVVGQMGKKPKQPQQTNLKLGSIAVT